MLSALMPSSRGDSKVHIEAYRGVLSSRSIRGLSQISGLMEDEIEAMSILSLNARIADLGDLVQHETKLRDVAVREWLYLFESHLCPHCLKESNAWQLSWRSPFHFMCLIHGCLLVHTCPKCARRPLGGHSRRSIGRPKFIRFIPSNQHCTNTSTGIRRQGERGEPCRQDLTTIDTLDLSNSLQLIETQRFIHAALESERVDFPANSVPTTLFFADLRIATAMLLHSGTVDLLGDIPAELRLSVEAAFDERERLRMELLDGREKAKGSKSRPFGKTPTDTRLMAALLPTALAAVKGAYGSGDSQALESIIDQVRGRRKSYLKVVGRRSASLFMKSSLGIPSPSYLVKRLSELDWAQFEGMRADHVPQLLPRPLFDKLFQPLGIMPRGSSGRRYVSQCLVRSLPPGTTWVHAAQVLGYSERLGESTNSNFSKRLKDKDLVDRFVEGLLKAASAISSPALLNYRKLRTDMAVLVEIPDDLWREFRRARRNDYRNSRWQATVLLWTLITDGDPKLAPAFSRAPMKRALELHGTFVNRLSGEALTVLTEYAATVREAYYEK